MKLVSIILVLSVLFCCDTRKEEPEYIEISLPTLINDVINGGLFYEDKHVKIRARVTRGGIETGRRNVYIYAARIGEKYEVGKTHTVKLHIYKIDYTPISARRTNWHIHATVED